MSNHKGRRKTARQGVNEETVASSYDDMLAYRWHRRRLNVTLLAALAGITLSLWLGRALTGRERNYAKSEFKSAAAQWSAVLQRVVTNRMGKVSTTAAFIYGSDVSDRKDFHTFTSQILKDTVSIEVLAWAPRIPVARRSAHEEAVRKEGLPRYVISDRDDQGRLFAAGKRDEYYPILFVEPFPENESLLGLDLGSDVAGRAAVRQAAATGHATVAVYTAFSHDTTGGNLLFVLEPARYESVASQMTKRPADQPETDGFVLGVIRMERIAKRWLNLPPGVDVYISANGKALGALHMRSTPSPVQGPAASINAPTEPPVGGALVPQTFEIGNVTVAQAYVATARYLADCGTWKPVIASLTGLFITALAVGYVWLLTGRMAAVERQVADRWLELRERERYIRHLIDNTGDAIFLCDEQGKILDINKRACDSLGYSREELLSMTTAHVECPVGTEYSGSTVKGSVEEYPRTFESVYQRKDGTAFPVEVHLTSVGSRAQPLILAIVRDITDRKRAENTLREEQRPSSDMPCGEETTRPK
jgi:PAS domain S-box-containing protein